MSNGLISAGMHLKFNLARFKAAEKSILNKMKEYWYLTSSGERIKIANSVYDYFLIKPTSFFTEQFSLDKEIVCVFSSYDKFEPRTLDAVNHITEQLSTRSRLESICVILISKDNEVEDKVKKLYGNDPDRKIIIPFSYQEIYNSTGDSLYLDKLRRLFYSKDLFSFNSPLKKDLQFFGRSQLVTELIQKHNTSEHTSIFGLRKSGKTSVVYAVQRKLDLENKKYISLDCESPSIHGLRWHQLLLKIISSYKSIKKSNIRIEEDRYDEINCANQFKEDFLKIYNSTKHEKVLIVFDEIERITPNTSSSDHWKNGNDFILFWQTLRSVYQEHNYLYTYMLVGTNPNSVEQSQFFEHDNPIYASVSIHYLPCFTLEQVEEMVNTLGNLMGLHFDKEICVKLKNDCGGHPFLIRQLCSFIHKNLTGKRPISIDKVSYNQAVANYRSTLYEYFDMMLNVLGTWYPEEYELLIHLALDDKETFDYYAKELPSYVDHLIKFGLIERTQFGEYILNLESLDQYLKEKNKFKKINLTDEDKQQEISLRRNRLEKKLRETCKNVLKIYYGNKAIDKVLSALQEKRRQTLNSNTLETMLHPTKSPLFFIEIMNLVTREWGCFSNVFDPIEKSRFVFMMEDINKLRADAHAKDIEMHDFEQIRLHFEKFEKVLSY